MTELATQAGYDSTGKGICTPQGGVLLRAWWRPGAPVAHEPAPARSADDDPPSGAFMNIPHRPATPTGTAAIQDRSARAELTATDRTGTRRAVPGNTSNRPELPAAAAARHRSGGTSDIGARGTSDNAIRTTSPEADRSPQPPDGRRLFPSRRADAIARYKAGETIGKIAAAFGVRPRTISKWLPAEVVTGVVTQRAQDAEALREAAKAAAITRYEAGETIREVATVLGKEPETVSGWLTGAGVAIRRGTLTEEQREDLQAAAAARYESGETISEIAADYGRSDGSVRNLLLGAGVQLRPPGGGRRQLIPHDQPAGL